MFLSTVIYSVLGRRDLSLLKAWRGPLKEIPRVIRDHITFIALRKNPGRDGMLPCFPPGCEPAVVRCQQGDFYIAERDLWSPQGQFEFFREPRRGSRTTDVSPCSDALYYGFRQEQRRALLLQELFCPASQSYVQTSSHVHRQQAEEWIVLHGECCLLTRVLGSTEDSWYREYLSADRSNGRRDQVALPPGIIHQIRTTTHALIYLRMLNCPEGDFYSDHHYMPPPPPDLI